MPKLHQKSKGFSLIEVLIAVVVGALGLLGLAAMLNVSVKHTTNSVYRTTATILASQLADSIRVNRDARAKYETSNTNFTSISASDPELTSSITLSKTNCYGSSKTCTPDDMANYDMYLWWEQAKTMLPEPTATIAIDPADNNRVIINLTWQERTNTVESDKDTGGKATGIKRSYHQLEVYP